VGENGDFQPLHPKISAIRECGHAVILLTIKWKFAVDFFARGLHARTAVARLPLRQLGFLVATMTTRKSRAVARKPRDAAAVVFGLKFTTSLRVAKL